MNNPIPELNPALAASPVKHDIPTHVWLSGLVLGLALLGNLPAMAAQPTSSVILNWAPSPSPGIAGYNIYSGGVSGIYTNKFAAGNVTNATLANLVVGSTFYFAATSYDTAGNESPFSNEAVYVIPAGTTGLPVVLGKPSLSGGSFSFTIPGTAGASFAVEISTNLIGWVRFQTNTAPFTFVETNFSRSGKRFYRTVLLP